MTERQPELLRVPDHEARGARAQLAGIADLPAAFGVERRALENDCAFRALLERLHGPARGVEQRDDRRLAAQRVVSEERRLALDRDAGREVGAELARGLRLPALNVHGALVTVH